VPDALDSFMQDIEWAKHNEEDHVLRAAFHFENLLLVAAVNPAEKFGGADTEPPTKKRKAKSGDKGKAIGLDWGQLQALHFTRVDEEALAYEAEWCAVLNSSAGAKHVLALLKPETVRQMVPKLREIMC